MSHELIGQDPSVFCERKQNQTKKTTVPLESLYKICQQTDPLITRDRIYASSRDGPFGGIFGRDCVITAEANIASYKLSPNGQFEKIIPPITALHRLIAPYDLPLAGINQGDLIHETRTRTEGYPNSWFVVGDERGFNYDSLDGPDRLINLDYKLISKKPELYPLYIDYIELMTKRGIKNSLEYEGAGYVGAMYETNRVFPGITDKRWRDGYATTIRNDLSIPPHPIRPVEEQALRWSALQYASELLAARNPELAAKAKETAAYVQNKFLANFTYHDAKGFFIADAVDATGQKIQAITTDQILVLLHDYHGETILGDFDLEQKIIQRSFTELFSQGGFKTVSDKSPFHPRNKYQGPNSRWPHACAMAVQAIDKEAGKTKDAKIQRELTKMALQLAEATLDPFFYFGSPIEASTVTPDGQYTLEYDKTPKGDVLRYARVQAWSGANGEFLIHYLLNNDKKEIKATTK